MAKPLKVLELMSKVCSSLGQNTYDLREGLELNKTWLRIKLFLHMLHICIFRYWRVFVSVAAPLRDRSQVHQHPARIQVRVSGRIPGKRENRLRAGRGEDRMRVRLWLYQQRWVLSPRLLPMSTWVWGKGCPMPWHRRVYQVYSVFFFRRFFGNYKQILAEILS